MQSYAARVTDEQATRIEARVDDGRAENPSEAIRQELADKRIQTTTRDRVDRIGNGFALIGLAMLGATLAFPIEVRIVTIVPLVAAIYCYSMGWSAEWAINRVGSDE